MEELIQQLKANAQNVDGTDMVELSTAIQAVQTATTIQTVDSLEKVLADLQQIYTDGILKDTEE
jgi:hypothetical protein